MPATITISKDALLISLGELGGRIEDRPAILDKLGAYMLRSVVKTYTDEGSPLGSWPGLAASTKKKKGYTAGHKLLVLTARLKNSLRYDVRGDGVAIGSAGVPYAGVQFLGSADRSGGAVGAQAKIAGRGVTVSAFDAMRVRAFRAYGLDQRVDKNGKARNIRVRAQGPDNATRFTVKAHTRHQNIPARNPLVFRPEDIPNMLGVVGDYLSSRGVTR